MADSDNTQNLELEIAQLKRRNLQLEQELSGKPSRKGSWRTYASAILLAASLVVLVPASALLWLNRTLIDPTLYAKAVGPIIQQPEVQKAITKSATDTLFANVDIPSLVSQALPQQAQFLAGPISGQVKTYTQSAVSSIVASPQFNQIWLQTNEKAHAVFIQVAKSGRTSPTININQVYQFISTQLQGTAIAPLLNKQLPSNVGDIQVASVPALVKIPHYVQALNTWRWVLIGLAVLLAALGIWVARNRRRAVMGVGLVWMLSALLTLAVVRVTRGVLEANIKDPTYLAAATAVWRTVLSSLFVEVSVIFAIGLIAIIIGWLAGPGKFATSIRTSSQNALGSLRVRWFPTMDKARAINYLQSHRHQGEWVILLLTILALIGLAPLTLGTIVIVLLITIVVLVIYEFLVAPAPTPRQSSG